MIQAVSGRVTPLRAAWLLLAALGSGLAPAGCASSLPIRRPLPLMGHTNVPAATMASWFGARTTVAYRASEPIEALAAYFVEEAAAERVRGDLAFVQAVHETNWFAFTGRVDPAANNFAGIGATDSGGEPHRFLDARTGVRAQIQHLRAYGDPDATTCTAPPLQHECVAPRFHLVNPKGRARTWQQMGNGNWATDPRYAEKILMLYRDLRQYARLPEW